jgi:hypothetical protein
VKRPRPTKDASADRRIGGAGSAGRRGGFGGPAASRPAARETGDGRPAPPPGNPMRENKVGAVSGAPGGRREDLFAERETPGHRPQKFARK